MALSSLGKLFQRPPEYHIVSDDGTNEKLLSKCSSQYPKEINRIFQALIPGVIAVLSLLALMLLIFLSATFYNASISQQLPNLSLMIPSHSQYPHLHEGDLRTKFQSPIKWNSSNYSPCGRTIASAQAAGCIFGPTTWAWYPKECYDFALEAEFLSLSDWSWYADESLNETTRLSREKVLKGEYRVAYMGRTYHKLHCAYSGRKLLRAVLGIVLADNYVLGMGHERHCEDEVAGEEILVAKGSVKFLDCVVI